MTAEQIRCDITKAFGIAERTDLSCHVRLEMWLAEIAAQLAELNDTLVKLSKSDNSVFAKMFGN